MSIVIHNYNIMIPFQHLAVQDFSRVIKIRIGEKESLDLKVIVPSEEEARLCIQTNHTLRAKLEIRWSGSEKVAYFFEKCFYCYLHCASWDIQFFCFEIEHRTASRDYFKTVKLKGHPRSLSLLKILHKKSVVVVGSPQQFNEVIARLME